MIGAKKEAFAMNELRRFFPLAGVFTLSACSLFVSPLREDAAMEFNCPVASLTTNEVGPSMELVRGCGKENVFHWDPGQGKWVSALIRASFDLSCPKDLLIWHVLGGGQVGVTGCARKAVYVIGPAGWINNSMDDRAPAMR